VKAPKPVFASDSVY